MKLDEKFHRNGKIIRETKKMPIPNGVESGKIVILENGSKQEAKL